MRSNFTKGSYARLERFFRLDIGFLIFSLMFFNEFSFVFFSFLFPIVTVRKLHNMKGFCFVWKKEWQRKEWIYNAILESSGWPVLYLTSKSKNDIPICITLSMLLFTLLFIGQLCQNADFNSEMVVKDLPRLEMLVNRKIRILAKIQAEIFIIDRTIYIFLFFIPVTLKLKLRPFDTNDLDENKSISLENCFLIKLFVAFCSFFPCSLTVVHRGRKQKSGGRQWKSSRADKQPCFP